jgi:hypothetical protein
MGKDKNLKLQTSNSKEAPNFKPQEGRKKGFTF